MIRFRKISWIHTIAKMRVLLTVGFFFVIAAVAPLPAFAVSDWLGRNDNRWMDNTNWMADPTDADVRINGGSNLPVLLDVVDTVTSCYLGSAVGDYGSLTLAPGGDLVNASILCVGVEGAGTMTQTGGYVRSRGLILADSVGSQGTYNISGGACWATGGGYIGARGAATVNISGGEFNFSNWGWLAGQQASLCIAGVSATEGSATTCIVNQTGGLLKATYQLTDMKMGVKSGATAIYNLDGGTLELGTNLVNGAGTSRMKVNGGKIAWRGADPGNLIDVDYFEVGTKSGAVGNFLLTTDKRLVASQLNLGSASSTGTMVVRGGTATVGDLIFSGATSRILLGDQEALESIVRVRQKNYSLADGLADVAAGYIASYTGGSVDVSTVNVGGINYTQFLGVGVAAVPEPSVIALLLTGLLGPLIGAWRKRKNSRRLLSLAAGMLFAASASPAFATTYWTGTISSQWTSSQVGQLNENWSADPTGTPVEINSGLHMPVNMDVADSVLSLSVGTNAGDNSSLRIVANSDLTCSGLLCAGVAGSGYVVQTGGVVQSAGFITADAVGSIGVFNIGGGIYWTTAGGYVGARGTARVNITGGTFGVTSWSPGAFFNVGGVSATDGSDVTCTINQTGGLFKLTSLLADVKLGVKSGATGVYNLDGGTCELGTNLVNAAGTGYLRINGGTLDFSGNYIDVDNLEIGTKNWAAGQFALAEGKTLAAGKLTLGAAIGTGTLTILGGSVTAGDLIFGGTTSKVLLDDLLSISILQSNYSLADGLADVAAGYVASHNGGSVVVSTVDIGGANYTQLTSIINPIPGDATLDGKVDADDAAILAGHWLSGNSVGWKQGDFNYDGKVDDMDAATMAANWQMGVEHQASVPEPAMPLLIAGVMLALFVWRKRIDY